MAKWTLVVATVLVNAGVSSAGPDPATVLGALAKLPVREITVFKDGHALLLHEGRMPVDSSGSVRLDYLPTPVLGTFWPYSGDKSVKLTAVTASPRRVLVERTALTVREMLEANPGTEVHVNEVNGKSYDATIVGVPQRSAEELESTSPPGSGERLPEKGTVILLKTAQGVSVVPIDRIQDVTLKREYKSKVANEEFRNLLTLKLDWPGGRPGKTADVGMMYLQKGVRWIPGYKIAIDGKGSATVKLQATLINEITDLSDVTANLVIGVPSFFFKDTPDPISLQQAVAQLGQYFQTDARTGFGMSNSIMSQGGFGGRGGEALGRGGAAPVDIGPEVAGGGKNEDLFVFTVKHVTLKKGERMVMPVAEFPLKYRDVYTLDLPLAPPPEARGNINSEQQAEIARLMAAPRAIHKIRLTNKSAYPLTTAPALLTSGETVLGQGMMTYTPIGTDVDVAITTAVDVKVKKTEKETARTPNAVTYQGTRLGRVDLAGTITLTNTRAQAVDLDVTRFVLGQVDKADHDGQAEMINAFEEGDFASPDYRPTWWNWYNWPGWWRQFNGIGRFHWTLKLDPGKTLDLHYAWHYFWE